MNRPQFRLQCGFLLASLGLFLAAPAVAQSSSSSDFQSQAEFRTNFQNQYPSGGGYGHGGYNKYPTYSSSDWHRIAIEAGAGFEAPVGHTSNELTFGWNMRFGGGYNFNRNFGALIEYEFERTGLQNSLLAAVGEPGGNAHIWSFSLEPIYNFRTSDRWGGYVTGGAGFYRRLTSFTQPTLQYGNFCSYFSCYPTQYVANVVVSHYSSNQAGMNIGGGLTWRLSDTSSGRLFADARYEWINTPKNATTLIPITFGYRW